MHWAVVLLLSCMKAYSFELWRSCHHVLCLSIWSMPLFCLVLVALIKSRRKIKIVGETKIPYNSSKAIWHNPKMFEYQETGQRKF